MKVLITTILTLQLSVAQSHLVFPVVSIKGGVNDSCPLPQLPNERQMMTKIIHDILLTKIVPPECGDGLWNQVAQLNMSDLSQQCPSEWVEFNSDGVRACRRPVTTEGSCSGKNYSSNGQQYSRVCGRVIGYQLSTPDAFTGLLGGYRNASIDETYIDGISITHGMPRNHIWSYAASPEEQNLRYSNFLCPCSSVYTGSGPQPFIGDNYYCESGNPGLFNTTYGHFFSHDKLWDGRQCSRELTCCTGKSNHSPPWFSVELPTPTSDNIEVRICADESTDNEDTPVELVEIYVQ